MYAHNHTKKCIIPPSYNILLWFCFFNILLTAVLFMFSRIAIFFQLICFPSESYTHLQSWPDENCILPYSFDANFLFYIQYCVRRVHEKVCSKSGKSHRVGSICSVVCSFVLWHFAHFQSKVNFATVKSPQHSWTNPYMHACTLHCSAQSCTVQMWIMGIVVVLTPFGKSCVIVLLEKFPTWNRN